MAKKKLTREEKKARNKVRREEGKALIQHKRKTEPGAFWTYVILRGIVIIALVSSIIREEYESAAVCVFVLFIYLLPQFVEDRFNIDIPSVLEIVIFVFVFAAEILGELESYFIRYPYWDTILHTTSGFLFAAVGYSLVTLLNRSENIKVQLSPIYLAITAFCFSMTIGVLWEFIEFGMDRLFLLDMQKDTVLQQISSVSLDETSSNISITVSDISDMILVHSDGTEEALGLGGYLDIGLYDTMGDFFVNFIGAVVFSVAAFFEERSDKRPLTTSLALRKRKKQSAADTPADA